MVAVMAALGNEKRLRILGVLAVAGRDGLAAGLS